MDISDKYLTLRKAMLKMIGIEDNKLLLLNMLQQLMNNPDADEGIIAVIVALIETDKQ